MVPEIPALAGVVLAARIIKIMQDRRKAARIGCVASLWLGLAVLAPGEAAAATQHAEAQADETFIDSLGDPAGEAIDTKRLARLFFSAAATLEGGRSNVRLLEDGVSIRDPKRESRVRVLRARYDEYAEAVGRFKNSATRWLDDPASAELLYRALMDGHQACWRFDAVVRLAANYGVSANGLLAVLASSEACGKLRRAAFQPRVEALVQRGLNRHREVSLENRVLREELRELEQLLDELRLIEEQ